MLRTCRRARGMLAECRNGRERLDALQEDLLPLAAERSPGGAAGYSGWQDRASPIAVFARRNETDNAVHDRRGASDARTTQ